jgi:hypothetical protein
MTDPRAVLPLAVDLYCGLGGWTDGLLAEGYRVVGFDNEQHAYGDHRYPAQLVLQDVRTIHGSQFKDAALIVASPPCQEFSYMAMPWSKAKAKMARIQADEAERRRLTALFDACFRIQLEACEAAKRHIPLVVENVCGAQRWVGRARWHFGSFYLWGDVPALMPTVTKRRMKFPADCGPRRWDDPSESDGIKVPGNRLSENGFAIPVARSVDKSQKPADFALTDNDRRLHLSYSRRAASAMIAKIPLPLARHIARAWYPDPFGFDVEPGYARICDS